MRFEKLTTKSQEALADAESRASDLGHPEVRPEHLLKALLEQREGAVPAVLEGARVPIPDLSRSLDARLKALPTVSGANTIVLSTALGRVLEQSVQEAERLQDQFVSTEHLLLALLDPSTSTEAGDLLRKAGATREAVYHALVNVRGGEQVEPRPGREVPVARQVRPRSHGSGAEGIARSGDRSRRGDPPRYAGAVPPDEEQPGPHW